jgi:hypothetical protein
VWCLKSIGGLIFAGMSDGVVHCFEIPPPPSSSTFSSSSSSSSPPPHFHALSASTSTSSTMLNSPLKSNMHFSTSSYSSSSSNSSTTTSSSSSSSSSPVTNTATILPPTHNHKPLHLWSFLACKPSLRNSLLLPNAHHPPRDGVRRLEIVNDKLYVVSQHGNVDLFKFFPTASSAFPSLTSSSFVKNISMDAIPSPLYDSLSSLKEDYSTGRGRGSFLSNDTSTVGPIINSTTTATLLSLSPSMSRTNSFRTRGSSFLLSSSSPPSSSSPLNILPDSSHPNKVSSSSSPTSPVNLLGDMASAVFNVDNNRGSTTKSNSSIEATAKIAADLEGTRCLMSSLHDDNRHQSSFDDPFDDLSSQLSSILPSSLTSLTTTAAAAIASSSSTSSFKPISPSLGPIRTGKGPCSTFKTDSNLVIE